MMNAVAEEAVRMLRALLIGLAFAAGVALFLALAHMAGVMVESIVPGSKSYGFGVLGGLVFMAASIGAYFYE